MATTNSKRTTRSARRGPSATVQWVAIGIVVTLAVLASFVFLGGDGSGLHLGAGAPAVSATGVGGR